MKKTILIIICTSATFIACNTPPKNFPSRIQTVRADTLRIVKNINHYKQSIDSVKSSLDSLQRNIYKSAEGGSIQVFYNRGDTLKKEVIFYGETGKRILNVYYREGKPILVEEVINYYQAPISVNEQVKIENKIRNVYYFNKKTNLIYWIKNRKYVPSSQYSKKTKEIFKWSIFR